MSKIFKNNLGEIRSGWKIVLIILLYYTFQSMLLFVPMIAAGVYLVVTEFSGIFDSIDFSANISYSEINNRVNDLLYGNEFIMLGIQVLSLSALILALLLMLKMAEKKNFSSIGFGSPRKNVGQLVLGLLLGILSMTVIFVILLFTGNISVVNIFAPSALISISAGLVTCACIGITEEALFRGYSMTALNWKEKPRSAVLISSAVFSAMHIMNPNFTILSFINILLIGVLFGYMFFRTGNIWMPVGFHITWNYFQGCIFGFKVSGLNFKGIIESTPTGSGFLTGGSFGPEAGVLATAVTMLSFFAVWYVTKNNARREVVKE